MWILTRRVFFCCNIDFRPTFFVCIDVSIYPRAVLLKSRHLHVSALQSHHTSSSPSRFSFYFFYFFCFVLFFCFSRLVAKLGSHLRSALCRLRGWSSFWASMLHLRSLHGACFNHETIFLCMVLQPAADLWTNPPPPKKVKKKKKLNLAEMVSNF